MARQNHHALWGPASLWLALLLAASHISPVCANGAGKAVAAPAPEAREPAEGRVTNLELRDVVELVRRRAAPMVEAVAAEVRDVVVEVRAAAAAAAPAAAPAAGLAAREPVQTPPPSLARRQADNGQIAALSAQIQSLSLVASSVSQASRSVSQTSQQLAQQVTQLSQSTDRLSQSINSLQNSMQQAQQSAQQAQDAARQASQSASSAISSAISSAASSASAAISSNMASVSSNAANIIAAASASAVNIASSASSQVQAAKADATVARADAASQVQKAQGAAVSVTQAALAIVGTFLASSLLTIGAFFLILRYKSNKRRRTRLMASRGTGYPSVPDGRKGDDDGATDDGSVYSYAIDLKDPPRRPSGDRGGTNSDRKAPGGDGYAFADRSNNANNLDNSSSGGRKSFSLFPRVPINGGHGGSETTAMDADTAVHNPTKPAPSLQQWLSQGTVSPFATLRRDSPEVRGASGLGGEALENKQQLLRAAVKRAMGVGGVNAGGGNGAGRVMQPGGSLPLRNS